MKAAVITIGDEILIGQITDTNSAFIAKALDKIGIGVFEMLSVSDDRMHILNTLAYVQNRVDVVVITGGLGPTRDDITKKTLCEYFDDELVLDQKIVDHVSDLIQKVMKRPATQMNIDQALVLSKSTVLFNLMGTAPGMWMEKGNTVFISLPGVPYEMKYLIENEVIPKLVIEFERPYILHKTILTYGQGESHIAERIEDWESNLPDFIKLAYLPSPGRVRLRLSAHGNNEKELRDAIDSETVRLNAIIGDIIIGFEEDETIEAVLGKLLAQRKLTIAVAESCTGGKLAQILTSIPGSSEYFKGGVVTYATESKTDVLGVPESILHEHTVVSAQVAEQMAARVKAKFKADIAISTTGNAGPAKGDSDAEVGTVYIGFATPEKVYSEKFDLGQPREKVIERAVNKALEHIYKEILKN